MKQFPSGCTFVSLSSYLQAVCTIASSPCHSITLFSQPPVSIGQLPCPSSQLYHYLINRKCVISSNPRYFFYHARANYNPSLSIIVFLILFNIWLCSNSIDAIILRTQLHVIFIYSFYTVISDEYIDVTSV